MSAKAEQYDVIRKPVITEKATMASEAGAVVFEVAMDANKPQIKEAVEAIYDKKVASVNGCCTQPRVGHAALCPTYPAFAAAGWSLQPECSTHGARELEDRQDQ